MSAHTKGPWIVRGKRIETHPEGVRYFDVVAHIDDSCAANAENARLIAAAPELLEAAKAWMEADSLTPGDCYGADGFPNENWGKVDRAKKAMRAAIAKAEGTNSAPPSDCDMAFNFSSKRPVGERHCAAKKKEGL